MVLVHLVKVQMRLGDEYETNIGLSEPRSLLPFIEEVEDAWLQRALECKDDADDTSISSEEPSELTGLVDEVEEVWSNAVPKEG